MTAKKAPAGVWFKRFGPLSLRAKNRVALTKRNKRIKVTLPGKTRAAHDDDRS